MGMALGLCDVTGRSRTSRRPLSAAAEDHTGRGSTASARRYRSRRGRRPARTARRHAARCRNRPRIRRAAAATHPCRRRHRDRRRPRARSFARRRHSREMPAPEPLRMPRRSTASSRTPRSLRTPNTSSNCCGRSMPASIPRSRSAASWSKPDSRMRHPCSARWSCVEGDSTQRGRGGASVHRQSGRCLGRDRRPSRPLHRRAASRDDGIGDGQPRAGRLPASHQPDRPPHRRTSFGAGEPARPARISRQSRSPAMTSRNGPSS